MSLLQASGNALVAANALAASGAQIILFTTGTGALLEGKRKDELADRFLDYILKPASGQIESKSEILDKHEIAIFKDGVIL